MKLKFLLILALAMVIHARSGAFTLDAVGYVGGALAPEPVSVQVAGYGELVFEAAVDSALVVGSGYLNEPCMELAELSFDADEAVGIVFKNSDLIASRFDVSRVGDGDASHSGKGLLVSHVDPVDFNGEQVGRLKMLEPVPEPTAALIGLIGGALLILRRLR